MAGGGFSRRACRSPVAPDDRHKPVRSSGGFSLTVLCKAGGPLPRTARLFRSGCRLWLARPHRRLYRGFAVLRLGSTVQLRPCSDCRRWSPAAELTLTDTKLPLATATGSTMNGCCSSCSGLRPVRRRARCRRALLHGLNWHSRHPEPTSDVPNASPRNGQSNRHMGHRRRVRRTYTTRTDATCWLATSC